MAHITGAVFAQYEPANEHFLQISQMKTRFLNAQNMTHNRLTVKFNSCSVFFLTYFPALAASVAS